MLKIREILAVEIPLLKKIPPEEWNLDLPQLIAFHFGYSYYYPVVAELDGSIVGFGNAFVNGKIGWLGNIAVLPEFRKQRIGHALTMHLVDYCKNRGCTSQILSSSEMGLSMYQRIGFQPVTTYLFYKGEPKTWYTIHANIRKAVPEDTSYLKGLDLEISGEERFPLIERFYLTAWVYTSDFSPEIRGVYLPDMGNGSIFARDEKAGVELMRFRWSKGKKNAVIPSENRAAQIVLQSEGFIQYRESPRMILGDEMYWKPQSVFNRGTGYCG
ncbi:MAG: GNAT family N-acetyltransferase [Bacteroidota bacterium]